MYNVIVISVGPTGMTAALCASRSNLSILMIEQGAPGGQMNNTAEIESYSGFDSIMGPDLAYEMREGVSRFGTGNACGIVQDIKDHGSHKKVICEDKIYEGETVVIATGYIHRKLGVSDEEELAGCDVSYCAVCSGALFRNKRPVVVGGEDSATEEAIYLIQFASEVVTVYRRDELRAQKTIQDHVFANEEISFMWDTVVEEIVGSEMVVTGMKICNVKTNNEFDLTADGVFIHVGLDPLAALFREAGLMNEVGRVPTDNEMKTSIPDVFTIGDIRGKDLRQVTVAAGDGGTAG